MTDLLAMPSLEELAADPSCAAGLPKGRGRYRVVRLAILGDALEQSAGCGSQPVEHRSWSWRRSRGLADRGLSVVSARRGKGFASAH
jgi:hypothetical protein